LPSQYRDFIGIFGKEEQTTLPPHEEHDVTIDLGLGKQPPLAKLYPLFPNELKLLKEYLNEIVKNGKIRPSKRSAGTTIFFAEEANS